MKANGVAGPLIERVVKVGPIGFQWTCVGSDQHDS